MTFPSHLNVVPKEWREPESVAEEWCALQQARDALFHMGQRSAFKGMGVHACSDFLLEAQDKLIEENAPGDLKTEADIWRCLVIQSHIFKELGYATAEMQLRHLTGVFSAVAKMTQSGDVE